MASQGLRFLILLVGLVAGSVTVLYWAALHEDLTSALAPEIRPGDVDTDFSWSDVSRAN